MIGIISTDTEKEIVKEFFELFKTPWEYFEENRYYDVVICTDDKSFKLCTKLLLIYNGKITEFDKQNQIAVKHEKVKCSLEYNLETLPIYGKTIIFEGAKSPVIRCKETNEIAGFEITKDDIKILRIGYNLFDEVSFLLSHGQPTEFSLIPTLDIHISLLRKWILSANIPLVEIPPVPAGYDYACCLTHDVDFAGIRNHKFDHTFFGFIYRASLGSLIDILRGRISFIKLMKNMKAVLMLPAVYLGIAKDYWMQFDDYKKIEKDAPSTFFFIPFKNDPGRGAKEKTSKWRATRYEISELKTEIQKLISVGSEIGVHGIDAWMNSEKGRRELNRISEISGNADIGVRMHWLYFNNESPRILEEAGFYYDSTLGYNDSVGYRNGTTQAFRPIGLQRLLELPLNVQDTALFYPGRMALSEGEALNLVDRLIENSAQFGGVLTINWHDRSLAPERLWGEFYDAILTKLREHNVLFATGRQIISWFNKRRSCSFEEEQCSENILRIRVASEGCETPFGLELRVYKPRVQNLEKITPLNSGFDYIAIPFSSNLDKEITLF